MRSIVALTGLLVFPAAAGEWPQWRGADGNGVAEAQPVVRKFSEDQNLLWSAPLPGRGGSTPVVWGERIFLTAGIDGKDGVLCFSWDGKELWRHRFEAKSEQTHRKLGSGCNPSPICDGTHVYVYFRSGTLAAFTLEGDLVWEKNLQSLYGKNVLKWDLGTSPIFAGKNIVVAVMHTDGESYVIALDRKSGDQAWKTARNLDTAPISGDGYATPIVRTINGVETIVVWGADHLTGYALETGKLLWTSGGFNPERKGNLRTIASVVETGGMALVPASRGHFVAGVKLGEEKIAWKQALGPDTATPVAHEGRFYVLVDKGKNRGTVHCLEAATGEKLWSSTLPKSPHAYFSSPLLVGGELLYLAREDGTVFSARVGKEGLEEVAESRLDDEVVGSPVAVGGKLLIRGYGSLHCIGGTP